MWNAERLARMLVFLACRSTDEVERQVLDEFPDTDRAHLREVLTDAVADRERQELRWAQAAASGIRFEED